ncbi:hypothetical protein DESUT3_32680 [Desulfuromonas versatilis]|uniref:Ribosomal protein L7/L12 C-terminal domain-containing protein n=1 Tax=Desulfuromonas versatilis TaxID=2802975 RepID=A0ABN6E3S4_9BACT|nr:ribosomal protein L7/L12 [Desulfuromonas versatilis]BCR06199.1 hypothetical protein DESUT3_32680 [Desulfuromonas versatilis]
MSSVRPPQPLPAEVAAALDRGDKIEAIKLLRETRAISLSEAKRLADAYLTGSACGARSAGEPLPAEVLAALQGGRKIEAIRLLRETRGIGLKQAKQLVEAQQGPLPSGAGKRSWKSFLTTLAVVAAFGWALATSVDAISSLIVLANLGGYRAETFTIGELRHDLLDEGGLLWGFTGRIAGRDERLYAPDLAEAKKLGFRGLKRLYPPGTEVPAWYNPQVTATLFQGRTLRVIPHTPDLKDSELKRFGRWVVNGLLPFLLVLFLTRRRDRSP